MITLKLRSKGKLKFSKHVMRHKLKISLQVDLSKLSTNKNYPNL